MAISVRGVSNAAGQSAGVTTTAGTCSIAVTSPASMVDGDRVFIVEEATAATMSTPTSWNALVLNQQIGSGAVSAGLGARYASVYWRDKSAGWSAMPTLVLTSATQLSHWVGAIAITPTSSAYAFDTPTISTVGTSFGSLNTAYSDTSNASFTTHSNGLLISASTFNDNITSSACAITQSGATFGTITNLCDGGTATGNDVSGKIHTCLVTTGANATITQTQTISANSQGETLFIEQTETPYPAVSTLTDDFDTGSTPDAAKWDIGANAHLAALTSGQLNCDSSSTSTGVRSVNFYTLISSAMYVQLNANTSTSGAFLADTTSYDFGWFFNGTTATVTGLTGGTSRTHTPGDVYRVRESAGTVYAEYSTDSGGSWNVQESSAVGAPALAELVQMRVRLSGFGTGTTTRWDYFNLAPPAPSNTGNFFALF